MKILLIGKNGQVGLELLKKLNTLGEIIATDRKKLDLANPQAIKDLIDQTKPNIVINTAAYTAVDKAESDPELCYQINVIASEVLAEKARELNIPLVYFSTDYVFDGLKKEPYTENDKVNPLSVYGKTKCEGEEKVRKHPKHIILRTSWVFSSHGSNFLKTMLRLIADKESLSIVADQWGSPSSASMLADVTFKIVDSIFKNNNFNDYGTYHVTNEGETNWHQYTILIADEARKLGLKIKCETSHIYPIPTSEHSTVAKRPLNSRLNTEKLKKTFMLKLPNWELEVKKVLRELI